MELSQMTALELSRNIRGKKICVSDSVESVFHQIRKKEKKIHGKYKEIFNSDRKEYGGMGAGNPRAKSSKAEECDERENSLKIRIPAFGAVVLSCTLAEKAEKKPLKKPAARKRSTAKKTSKKPAA